MSLPINPLVAMFDGEPVLLAREYKAQFEAALAQLAAHTRFDEMMAEGAAVATAPTDGFWPAADDWRAAFRPYVVENGTLIIPIKGVLLHNFPWQFGNYATGYEYIWRAFERGLDDGSVQRIALVVNSGGGLVAGNQDLVDRMFERRDEKPLRAFAHEYAYSAAYNIASVAPDGLVVSRTGGVGSIGVRGTHVDWSKWNEAHGLTYTFIFAGEGKLDGDPDLPLSEDALARLQDRIDELYGVFVGSVARNRGIAEDRIRGELKAFTYTATQAKSNGLADTIGRLDDALSDFADDLSITEQGDENMSTPDNSAANKAAIDQALATARSEAETTQQAAVAAAVKADRERQQAITGSEEAKGREQLASHIALNTEMSVDDAKTMLAAAPLQAAAPAPVVEPGTPFNAAAGADTPNLGAEGGEPQGESASSQILAAMFGPKQPELLSVERR